MEEVVPGEFDLVGSTAGLGLGTEAVAVGTVAGLRTLPAAAAARRLFVAGTRVAYVARLGLDGRGRPPIAKNKITEVGRYCNC